MRSGHGTMRIIITGTPGTGKSLIAKKLSALLGLKLFSITALVRQRMRLGRSHEVDLRKLAALLRFLRNEKNYVVEGHLACEIRLPADAVVVLRTRPDVLRKRMAKRRYPKRKTEDNLLAEMLDYCTQRVERVYGRRPLELDTTMRTVRSSADELARAVKQKKKRLDKVDYIPYLKEHLHVGTRP